MLHRYQIRQIKFKSGERHAVLIHPNGSVPFYPSYYAMSVSRIGKSVNTVVSELTAIKHLYTWADTTGVDLHESIVSGKMLSLSQIDSLVHACQLSYKNLVADIESSSTSANKVLELRAKFGDFVSSGTQSIRLNYIIKYLDWLIFELFKKSDAKNFSEVTEKKKDFLQCIKARIPNMRPDSYSAISTPKGYDLTVHRRILDVIEPTHPDNPWRGDFVRHRNCLYVNMCLALGLRLGDTESLEVTHIVRTANPPYLQIHRKPDNPEDPRIREPNIKTLPRTLVIERAWFHLLCDYIDIHRRKLPATKRHPFLFVSRSGQPISRDSARRIVTGLRQVDGIPDDITQHTLRHAWNERFSEICDERGVSPEQEAFARREYMGWSPSSGMPARYNRRRLKRKADEYSLEMQSKIIRKK
ncbi:tyrosine-type recombinase/integrase [uncultured Pseudodesulfovibrio sp.]|uniref:tyrosine-type recombinase/integrase n=1 Tax=uncultured Pseudodesulfovibrio sp. TaxID=2035858 RepID=UPI0029C625A9|nr:tyrosine-type recombinase/integrase [uncultured Pseudodesulfovibrio sp.]